MGVHKERKPNAQGDLSYHPDDKLVLYSPPLQRQKWGDKQSLPRTNYSDLFFDLFYVALAYNAGNILNADPSLRGFLYFCGTFFPAMDLWLAKGYYDARFALSDDLFHRIEEIGVFVVTATLILHVGPVSILSNPRDHIDMFVFSLTMAVVQALAMAYYVETYFFGVGQREIIKLSSTRQIITNCVPLAFYLAAAVVSGLEFYGHNGVGYDKAHRLLAGDDGYGSDATFSTDWPIWLCLAGSIANFLYFFIQLTFFFPNDGSHKNFTIPINIGFVIHRNGEWVMLMLGESVLSLLIVDVIEGTDYYITFFGGLLTVILLQYLHFRSQPHSADEHAMRRDKNAGLWFGFFMKIYSAALVIVGVCDKLFLYDFTYEGARRLVAMEEEYEKRMLAGGGASDVDPELRQQRSANLFVGAMATIWLCLDIMLLLHKGLKPSLKQCERCPRGHKKNYRGIFLLVLRLAMVVWMATLSLYVNDPEQLAVAGFIGVIGQLALRKMGGIFFDEEHHDDEHDGHHDTGEAGKWPNTTHARALHDRTLREKELKKDLAEMEAQGSEH